MIFYFKDIVICYRSQMESEIRFNDIMNLCRKETNIDDFQMTKKNFFKLKRHICNNDSSLEIVRLKRAYESFFKIKSKFLETNEYWKTLTFIEYIVCTGIHECFSSFMNTNYVRLFYINNLSLSWTPTSKCKFSKNTVDYDFSKNCSNKLIVNGDILLSPVITYSLPKDYGIGLVIECGKHSIYYSNLENAFTTCTYCECECSHCLSVPIPICLIIDENKDYDISIFMLLIGTKDKMTIIDKMETNIEKLNCFSDTCSICMEKFNDNELEILHEKFSDVFVTSCGHAFHKKCVHEGASHLFTHFVKDEGCIDSECTHNLFEDDEDKCPKAYIGFKCPNCRMVT